MQMRHISGLNFRVSHAVTGCAEPLFRQICPERPSSLLLAGAVGSGKTTMLRDLCRLLGASWRLTLVDERSEIAAVHHGVPQYDVGLHTDVLDGFPRAEGLLTALRVLTRRCWSAMRSARRQMPRDRKSTRLNSSHRT